MSTSIPTRLLRSHLSKPLLNPHQTRTLSRMSLIGRLAATPEHVTAPSGRDIVRYSVGVSTGNRENPDTSWFRCTMFPNSDAQRDFMLRQQKGQQVYVEADGKMLKYEVREGDEVQKRTRFELVQRSLELLAPPRQTGEQGAQEAATASHSAEAGDEAT